MKNSVAKTIDIFFEKSILEFEDACHAVDLVTMKPMNAEAMHRSGDTRWFKQPYIMKSYDGLDQTGNWKAQTRLYIPATLGYKKSVPFYLDMEELNDMSEEEDLEDSAGKRLASDINESVLTVLCNQATNVITKASAANGFQDVAKINAVMNRIGVQPWGRRVAYTTEDHNGLAGELAGRGTVSGIVSRAYEESYLGKTASIEVHNLDSGIRCNAAAATGITIDTRRTAGNYHVPLSETRGTNQEMSPYDNRSQLVTFSSTTGMEVGDAFTMDGVTEAHRLNKRDTGHLSTHRIMKVQDATHAWISPPIISNQGPSLAEECYQNCHVEPAAAAPVVFLNLAAAPINPFFQKEAVWLMTGQYNPPKGTVVVRRAKTRKGIPVVLLEQFDIETGQNKYRLDAKWGVVYAAPEQGGIELFNQVGS